jgi:NADPH-dependent curcumin reductase CurA
MGSTGVPFKNMDQIVMKRLQMKGFIVGESLLSSPILQILSNPPLLVDYLISSHPLVPKFWEQMTAWVSEGKVTMKEDKRAGIESFPQAFCDILHGRNEGKLMIAI